MIRRSQLLLNALIGVISILLFACGPAKEASKPQPAETPEQVVAKFYQYIGEGGLKTTEEAYKMVSTVHSTLHEGRFKEVIKRYPPGMKVTIKGTSIDKDRAKVSIECSMPSAFGAYLTQSDIHLDLDPKLNAWRIDFSGDTYDEVDHIKAESGQTAGKDAGQAGHEGHKADGDHKGHEEHPAPAKK